MKVELSKASCFAERARLERLRELVETHRDLMPHQLAAATGCSLEEAMYLLMLLYDQHQAEPCLLVYHRSSDHPNVPIDSLRLTQGPPSLPLTCSVCNGEITDPDDLSYDFLFLLRTDLDFVV